MQALSKDAPQSAPGDQFLERDEGGGQEHGASREPEEITNALSILDPSAHGAEILARPPEPAFRSELTKAAERAVPVPAEAPAAVIPNTGGTMRLQFEPPDLGRVTVQVSVQAQQVHATVSVQHEGLGQFLTTSQGLLDEAMRQHGLRVEEFRVDLDAGQAGQGPLFGEHLPGFQDREGGRSTGTAKEFESLPIEKSSEGSSLAHSAHRINLFA
jgi:flagellar hook-length control protein FliK